MRDKSKRENSNTNKQKILREKKQSKLIDYKIGWEQGTGNRQSTRTKLLFENLF